MLGSVGRGCTGVVSKFVLTKLLAFDSYRSARRVTGASCRVTGMRKEVVSVSTG